LTDIVTNGVRSMPAFRSILTEKDIADVVQFLLSEWGTG
jgi:mono/diheme cytochrome c family protein